MGAAWRTRAITPTGVTVTRMRVRARAVPVCVSVCVCVSVSVLVLLLLLVVVVVAVVAVVFVAASAFLSISVSLFVLSAPPTLALLSVEAVVHVVLLVMRLGAREQWGRAGGDRTRTRMRRWQQRKLRRGALRAFRFG